jgi:periplasmic divalent cation tolerance protein
MQVRVVFCTCPDADTAMRIADALVGERLAACVNVLPGVRSVYRWRGTVERADEVMLVIKTRAERLPALSARIQSLHPHQLPEVLAVAGIDGLPAYLQWIVAETASESE